MPTNASTTPRLIARFFSVQRLYATIPLKRNNTEINSPATESGSVVSKPYNESCTLAFERPAKKQIGAIAPVIIKIQIKTFIHTGSRLRLPTLFH